MTPPLQVRSARQQLAGRFSRPPLERMLRLHERLKAGVFPNCRKLADELEVSPKTIQRDIDFMRDRLGLPIEYDPLQFGFYYTEPVANFPSIEVSQGEIIALFVARKALEQYRGTSFERSLRTAFHKISEGLHDKIDFQWADVDSAISFREHRDLGVGHRSIRKCEQGGVGVARDRVRVQEGEERRL